ncbi:MAG: GNAT family protein [Bacteriovorax sp.]|nr:GNAT family protein [Bacteriovorax sp.]
MNSALCVNKLNQPIGHALPNWESAQFPNTQLLIGEYCRLERLDPKLHSDDLFKANSFDQEGRNWTYLPYGPFDSYQDYSQWLEKISNINDPYFFAIIDLNSMKAIGLLALMRISPEVGTIEVGHINYSPLLQKNIAATEAMYLIMKYCFAIGYRRYEWKCDHLNEASRLAAIRLGFQFEGTFRQATIYKGRTRDTDWFSILDSEWPKRQSAFEAWLSPKNFDQNKIQIKSLARNE